MSLAVASVSEKEIRLRLKGAASLERSKAKFKYGYEADFSGVLVYDLKKGAFSRFDFLALGEWTWNYERKGPQKDILGVALEILPRPFASPEYDRHFPGFSMSNYGYRQDREQ